jgi:hypothetical protein
MKSFKEALDSDICRICGQTPCNCTTVSEAIVPPSERSTMKHRFLVTYSEPHHTMASQRKELKQKHVRVPATDKENKTVYKGEAEPLVKKYMKKQGYKVHNVEHVGLVNEDLRDPKDNPCWTGYKPIGTKKKNGRTVPNCVPTSEAVNPAQQAAIAIAMEKAGKKPKKVDEVSDKSLTDYLEAHYADKQKPESDPTKRPSFKAKRTELRQHTAMNKLEARPNPHDTQNEEVEQIEELMGTAVKVMHPHEVWKASQDAKKKKPITDLETLAKRVKPVKPIKESHYEEAQEHMSKATQSHNEKDIHAYYGHMANYHEALARWHEERGRHGSAEKHSKLADEHHEMNVEQSRKLKEGTSAATRLKGNLKKSGFDMDASAARLKAIEDKYKSQNDAIKKREEQKKVTEEAIQEGIAGLVSNSIKRITAMTPQQKAEIRMNKRKAGNGVNK